MDERIKQIIQELQAVVGNRYVWYSYAGHHPLDGNPLAEAQHNFGIIVDGGKFFGGAITASQLYNAERSRVLAIEFAHYLRKEELTEK